MYKKSEIHSLKSLKEYRKNLRKNLTPAEATLWRALKNSQLEKRKFIRQHSIENYIVDFYCPAEKLIIELDGRVHFNSITSINDYERDERLRKLGYTVLRFENKIVFQEIEGVLAFITFHFAQNKPPQSPQ